MKTAARLITLGLAAAMALSAADNALSAKEKSEGWILLFDGKTMAGWNSAATVPAGGGAPTAPNPAVGSHPRACSTRTGKASVPGGASHWEIVQGSLSPCSDPAGYLSSDQTWRDFILTLDFRTGEDTNSGVFVRSPRGIEGYEVQIWKAQPAGYNTGSIVGTAKTDGVVAFRPNEWNRYEITADGDHLVVVLNGAKTVDTHDARFSEGHIRLQYQKFPIEFRNIRLKPIRR